MFPFVEFAVAGIIIYMRNGKTGFSVRKSVSEVL